MTDKNNKPVCNQRRRIAGLAAAAAAIGMTIGISPAQAIGLPAAPAAAKASTDKTAPRTLRTAQAGNLPKPGAQYPKVEIKPGAQYPKVEIKPGAQYPKVEIKPGAQYPKVEISPVKG